MMILVIALKIIGDGQTMILDAPQAYHSLMVLPQQFVLQDVFQLNILLKPVHIQIIKDLDVLIATVRI